MAKKPKNTESTAMRRAGREEELFHLREGRKNRSQVLSKSKAQRLREVCREKGRSIREEW